MKRFATVALALVFLAMPAAIGSETPVSTAELQQSKKLISGAVLDRNGQPVIGATVMVPGTTIGAVTDINGRYSISIPSSATSLEVSCMGYKPKTISVGASGSYNATLDDDTELLEETIVVGYGVQKKSNLTGAIASVKSEALEDIPAKSITEAIQGKVAGVYVSKSAGVGAGSTIYIRGAGSVNGLQPLYIIDGMPGGSNVGLNMDDIESLEVIKDASAAAIYGASAAGGVILITTKKGAEGTPKVTFNAKVGLSTAGKSYDLLNTEQYLQMRAETTGSMVDLYNQYKANPSAFPDTDWAHELNLDGTGMNQQYDMSVSGQNGKFNYYLSGQYQKEDGLQYDWWRYMSTLAKVEYAITPKLKIGTRFSLGKSNNNSDTVGWRTMMRSVPFMTVYEDDGSFTPVPETANSNAIDNYVAELDRNKNQRKGSLSAQGQAYIDWTIIPGLTFNVTGMANMGSSYSNIYTAANTTRVAKVADSYSQQTNYSESYRYFATLTYDKTFAKYHNINVMAGYEAAWAMSSFTMGTGTGSQVSDPVSLSMVTTKANSATGYLSYVGRAISQFARLNYSYKDRYLLTANVRRDGSTKFGSNNRFGVFPSVSVGWKISEEPWFKDMGADWISMIKPRVSYGALGNTDALSEYAYQPAYSSPSASAGDWWAPVTVYIQNSFTGSDSNAATGYSVTKVTNKDLKWETIKTLDAGIDLAFFQNRLEASFDWYNRSTTGMLYKINLPSTSGVSGTMPVNLGSITNKGVEFAISWRDRIGELNYSISGNISHNETRMVDIGDTEASISAGTLNLTNGNSSLTTGKGTHYTVNDAILGRIYGFRTDGIIQSQSEIDALNANAVAKGFSYYQTAKTGVGDLKYVDVNGDGHIDSEDADFIGNPWPKIQYGGNISLEWRGIDFSADFVGLAKRDVVNCMKPFEYLFQTDYQTTTAIYKTSFTNGNGLTEYPRVYDKDANNAVSRDPNGNYQVMSDFMVEDGSFMKIKNITIGYTFPHRLTSKIGLEKARIYFNGNNLFTFTKFSGLDPEFSGGVTDFGSYSAGVPMTKLYTFGVDLAFGGRRVVTAADTRAADANAALAAALAAANDAKEKLAAENESLRKALQEANDAKEACEASKPKTMAQRRAEALHVEDVYFDLDKSEINDAQMPKVERLIKVLKANPEATVSITGYADQATGTEQRNYQLTKLRSEAVASALRKAGISPSRISTEYYGTEKDSSFTPESNRVAVCIVNK